MDRTTSINGRQVKIKVNETACFSLSLDLQLVNNIATTYMITASFEDTVTQPVNTAAWARTLEGQQYAACTTTQYGYDLPTTPRH
jgi:hypothetical protein